MRREGYETDCKDYCRKRAEEKGLQKTGDFAFFVFNNRITRHRDSVLLGGEQIRFHK